MVKCQARASAARWAGLGEFLVHAAWMFDVDYCVIAEFKGLLHTTIYFKVEGRTDCVERYIAYIRQAFDCYTGRSKT